MAAFSDPISLIREYEKPLSFFSLKKKSADRTVSQIMQSIQSTPLDNWGVVKKIDREFKQKDKESSSTTDLKASFCKLSGITNWKNAVIKAHYIKEIDVHFPFIQYANDVKLPITTKERTLEYSGKDISAVFGSTFSTNKAHRLDDKGHHLLDAAFGGICLDEKGSFNGYALALGDGAGGHFGEPVQDKRIARAAHFATKTAVRLLSAYHSVELLQKDIQKIPSEIAQEIKAKVMGEGSTLVCCRAFPTKEGYRLLGFNLGDGMLIAWNPWDKKGISILPSHVSEAGSAFFPETYRQFELQYIDTIIPNGCYLFLMSDGVHDALPYSEVQSAYPNNLIYRARTLTQLDNIWGHLPATASPKEYFKSLVNKSFEGAEELRKTHVSKENVQIGDDFSVLECYLKP